MACCGDGGACFRKVRVGTYDPATEETTYADVPECIADWLLCTVQECTCEPGECRNAVGHEQP